MNQPTQDRNETLLEAIFDRCNSVRQLPMPEKNELPEGFRGLLGHFPVYFPEEIAHAAGLMPVAILGGGNKLDMKLADAHMGSFVCSICRSTSELGLNGSLAGLSGFVPA